MNTEWMGRYRPLVAALVRHSNIVQRRITTRVNIENGIILNAQEWQVFEYIIEHLNDDAHMNLISDRLGIPQSSFSKIVKVLCSFGLVEKYQMTTNKKNIILRPSDYGLSLYAKRSPSLMDSSFGDFFDQLESFSDSDINQIAKAIEILNNNLVDDFNARTGHLVKKTE